MPSGAPGGRSSRRTLPSGVMTAGRGAGAGERQRCGGGVPCGVQAGGQCRFVEVLQGGVKVVQDLVGGHVEAGQGAHGDAHLAHHSGGGDAVAHHISDDQEALPGAIWVTSYQSPPISVTPEAGR